MTDQVDSSGATPVGPDEPAPPAPPTPRRGTGLLVLAREAVVVVAAALVLSLLVKTFLVQAFFIPSQSMQDTLLVGDRVLVSELTPGPFDLERGDVVVFRDPGGWLPPAPVPDRGPVASALVSALTFVGVLPQDSGEHLIKRVIGLPGDAVACCDPRGRMTVNGVPLTEPYLAPGAVPSEVPFSTTVPAGRLWVQGDNRQESLDSRYHQDLPGGGSVPEDLVVGRAVLRVWPVTRLGWLSDHAATFARVPAPAHAR